MEDWFRKARLGECETDTEKSVNEEGCRKTRIGGYETDKEQEWEAGRGGRGKGGGGEGIRLTDRHRDGRRASV